MAHACENCKFRAHYDAKPNSALGRFLEMAHQFLSGMESVLYLPFGRRAKAITREIQLFIHVSTHFWRFFCPFCLKIALFSCIYRKKAVTLQRICRKNYIYMRH